VSTITITAAQRNALYEEIYVGLSGIGDIWLAYARPTTTRPPRWAATTPMTWAWCSMTSAGARD